MSSSKHLDIAQIETAITKGAKFLLQSLYEDGGIKYEDEKSKRSGVWVTAEALEFFLTARSLPIVSFSKVKLLIEYILQQQRGDGSWSILSENEQDKSSAISTGHCVYVLKIAVAEDFMECTMHSTITSAIERGERWLRTSCIEKYDYVYWDHKKNDVSSDPNYDERSRIEFVFSSYYAIMGLLNPLGYHHRTSDSALLAKASRFFKAQAQWFLDQYNQVLESSNAESLSNVASTFCRFVNVSKLLGGIFSTEMLNKLKTILAACSLNPFTTTKVMMETTFEGGDTGFTYTNNTPFDMGIALLNLETDVDTIHNIIITFLKHQSATEGYWFLNFHSSYKIKTWTTSEALLVLEKALHVYNVLELEKQRKTSETQCAEAKKIFEEKEKTMETEKQKLCEDNTKMRKSLLLSAIISISLASSFIIGIVFWISQSSVNDTPLAQILRIVIIPIAISILYDATKLVRSFRNRK